MIKSIKIEKLFDIFDYDISFQNEENILIITGPNGFGKTKILNIIHSLFNREFEFFDTLAFDEIRIELDNDISILIIKVLGNEENDVVYGFFEKNKLIYELKLKENKLKELDKKNLNQMILERLKTNVSSDTQKLPFTELVVPDIGDKIFNSIKVHLIREQRLLKIIKANRFNNLSLTYSEQISINETIQTYADELKKSIKESLEYSAESTRELDSSFPKRLLAEKESIASEEFKKRFNSLKEKQHKLKVYGISESEQEVPEYSERDSRALLVYLKDSEKKISVFDEIVGKLELFTSILNERRLTFKSIKIDKEKGFIFVTDKGKELKLTDLSSGEQHEVVLLYELIFNTKENTVLLIDEPEISLHITWQKEFVKDLIKIIKLQKIQVIIATHAPSIINDRWDLVYSLDKAGV